MVAVAELPIPAVVPGLVPGLGPGLEPGLVAGLVAGLAPENHSTQGLVPLNKTEKLITVL